MASITYLDDRIEQRLWKPAAPIYSLTEIEDYLRSDTPTDVLIIHGGHRDALRVGSAPLIQAVLRVLKSGGRAVVFSGGQPRVTKQEFQRALGAEGFFEGKHYLVLTAVANLGDEIDFVKLESETIDRDWQIQSVKRHHAAPTLLGLAVLAQAALFAAPSLDEPTIALLGGQSLIDKVRQRAASLPAQNMLTRQAWLAAFSESSSAEVLTALHREWPADAPEPKPVEHLIKGIFGDTSNFNVGTISAAYAALSEALKDHQRQQVA